ncbi:penicillin-binding transpeptidase domain-containing protein [Streptomyces sp. URMC 123]|uniref:penicillin-binding transpeptidase domain-containing protein n=1 Tax=Streptomyces sp. URMC 123 TaxID=3423403 RepID=UPI003F1CD4E5
MRTGAKVAVVGGVFTAVLGAAGLGAYTLLGDGTDGTFGTAASDGKGPEPVRTGPPTAAEIESTAREFLDAWAAGDVDRAASFTDNRDAAKTALTGYRDEAHVTGVTLTPGAPEGAKVPFSVAAEIVYDPAAEAAKAPDASGAPTPAQGEARPSGAPGGPGKTLRERWSYRSALTVVRGRATGRALVDWQPSVLHPGLRRGETLRTGPGEAPPIKAVDRNGKELTKESHPALAGVLASLRERYGTRAGGAPGVELRIDRPGSVNADGTKSEKQADETLKVLSTGTPGTLRTTLDARLQSAAEQAVARHGKASVVALKPSTGEILAVANSPAEGFNTALQGSLAPGSTMKIVSASMLLEKGLAVNDKPHPCPKFSAYGGWRFQNLDQFEIAGGTFAQSFARSCNTAFISQAEKLPDDALTQEARDVYGIGLDWQTGVPTFDGTVPVQSAASKAASLIGQGGVRMNPLTMASIAATARTGVFRQPVVVSPSLDNRPLARASRAMSPEVARQLKALMRLTAASGTAAEAMRGISGDVGAKTGSAEVDGQEKPNGWFAAYRGDLAAAAVVPAGGHGGSSAGPVVAAVLRAG